MKVISKSVKETINIGKSLARKLKKGDIICLFGELGSGKTVLTKGIACGLKIPKEEVISPTFVLIRQYQKGDLPIYHFDLYRLKSPDDIALLGYEEYFYDQGVSVIEWPDRLKYLAPKDYLRIDLKVTGVDKRLLKFSGRGSRYKILLGEISEDIGN